MDVTPHSPTTEKLRPIPRLSREATPLTTRAAGRTDRGRVRKSNEDRFLFTPPAPSRRVGPSTAPAESQLLVVADGMGGHAAGERASSIAVRSVGSTLLPAVEWLHAACDTEDHFEARVLAEVRRAMERAHTSVRDEAAADPEIADMGTTLTVAYRHGERLFVAHVGDSRCYLLRDGLLIQITSDHTLVSELIRDGYIDSIEEAHRSMRNVLTNALGGVRETIHVETHRVHLRPGDVVLLCTDGLTGMLSDAEIESILCAYSDPHDAAQHLVAVANEAGGLDNVTAIVARCDAKPDRP